MTAAREPYPAAARSLLLDTIFAATGELVRERGWSATTMADIARASGVSRQTLYNAFGSRARLVEAYVAHEVDTFLDAVSEAVRMHADDPHRALRVAFTRFLELASNEPVVLAIAADDDAAEPQRLLTGLGVAMAGERLTGLLTEIWPRAAAADAHLLAETLARLAVSHALLPSADAGAAARNVGRALAPFVDQTLGLAER